MVYLRIEFFDNKTSAVAERCLQIALQENNKNRKWIHHQIDFPMSLERKRDDDYYCIM